MNPMPRLTVLLCSEGTYPYYSGGVSVWCDQLVHALEDIDFRVFAITHSPNAKVRFNRPPNVVAVDELPLWGTEEPGRAISSFLDIYDRKTRTTSDVIHTGFLEPFSRVASCILREQDPEALADSLLKLHLYFKRFDYVNSMRSFEAWEAFVRVLHESVDCSAVAIHDAVTCMRWLTRFLGVLTVPLVRADITHSSIAGLAGIPGVLAKLIHGTPFLLTEHGIFLRELYLSLRHCGYSEPCRRFLLAFHRSIVTMNYHFADHVTALGDFNKLWQIRLGVAESKIRITPNGLDPAPFRSAVKQEAGRPVVLTMARVYHLKGIEHLLRAAARVRSRIPRVLFRILGDIADPTYYHRCLEIVRELNLDNNVEFDRAEDPASAYAAADVFCLPSISEGMPYSILEAMFSSCPVVATDVGNVAEMLGSTGLVVRPADPESLAEALLSLLDGGDAARDYRRTIAGAAEERALALYTVEKATDTFRQLYRELNYENRSSKFYTAAAQ